MSRIINRGDLKMDNRPIGVFDSGIGGITAAKRIMEILPNEDIIYFGDTLRAPYGSRPVEEIIKFASEEAAFLSTFDVKAMIIACNSICVWAHEILQSKYDIPIYEVINPAAEAAVASSKNKKIGVIATSATIKSNAYEMAIGKIAPDASVYSVECPRFVPLVESGKTSPDDPEAFIAASEYLAPLCAEGMDTLILGCTHYPLLSGVISRVVGPDAALINSGAEVISRVAEDFSKNNMLNESGVKGTVKYYVTGDVEKFGSTASIFLGHDVSKFVEKAVLG